MVEVGWQKKLHEMRKTPKREEDGYLWTFGPLAGHPLLILPVVGQIDVVISYLSVLFSTFVVADQKDPNELISPTCCSSVSPSRPGLFLSIHLFPLKTEWRTFSLHL